MPDAKKPPPGDKVPYLEAAAQVAAGVDQGATMGAAASAGDSLAQMSTAPAEALPHEATMDAMMTEFKAMSERVAAMEKELGQARRGYAAAVAQLGPPEVVTYAKAIYDKLVSFRAAHPDVPAGHFDAVIQTAAPLAEAAQAVIDGTGQAEDVTGQLAPVVDAVTKFLDRHVRKSGKPIDFSAIRGDLEDATDAAEAMAS